MRVPSGTTGAQQTNKRGSAVPEGTSDYYPSKPSVKTLGYYQKTRASKPASAHPPEHRGNCSAPREQFHDDFGQDQFVIELAGDQAQIRFQTSLQARAELRGLEPMGLLCREPECVAVN